MQRPTWATVVGVLGILFGVFGVLNAIQSVALPFFFELQERVFDTVKDQAYNDPGAPVALIEMIDDMFDLSGWQKLWFMLTGFIALIINGFYLYAAIILLQVRQSAIRTIYIVLWVSIMFALIQGLVGLSMSTLLGFGIMIGSLFSIALDAILLIVVSSADKSAFRKPPQPLTATT